VIFGDVSLVVWGLTMARFLGLSLVVPGGYRPTILLMRIAGAALLTMIVRPSQFGEVFVPDSGWLNVMIEEIILGVCCGLAIAIAVASLGLVTTSPVGDEGSSGECHFILGVWHRFAWMFAIALFLTMDGHRTAVRVLLDFMAQFPPGRIHLSAKTTSGLMTLATASIQLTLRGSQPFLFAAGGVSLVGSLVARITPGLAQSPLTSTLHCFASIGLILFGLGGIGQNLENVSIAMLEALRATFADWGS
jgi:type III secretory pathway component EscT